MDSLPPVSPSVTHFSDFFARRSLSINAKKITELDFSHEQSVFRRFGQYRPFPK